MLSSLLIPLDLSPSSERVVARAALLPLPSGARVTLLHVVPRLLQRESRARAEEDAQQALEATARRLGPALPRGTEVHTVVKVGVAAAEISKEAKSRRAGLIVVGRGNGRALDLFLGSTAERVIRKGQLPVLVVRLAPRAPYRRPAIALDLDLAAREALAGLLSLTPSPHLPVTAIHAYDAPYQGLIYPSLSPEAAEAYRDEHRAKALRELERLLTTSMAQLHQPPERGTAWNRLVQYGPARTVIERAVKKVNADLLVLGTHGYSGVAHAFLGTVAGDVLREVACDVLVVPPLRLAAESS